MPSGLHNDLAVSMEKPLITFILFAYNQKHYVRDAIEGILAQTYSPLEVILSDDGSKDRTFEIMTEMAQAYQGPHMIILNRNEPNLGIGPHVNKAFSMANGEWIVTGAGDDISDADRCERLMEIVERYPQAGAIGSGWRRIDSNGRPLPHEMLGRYRLRRIDRAGDTSWIDHYRRGDFGLWGMSVAWRTEMLRKAPLLPPGVIQEDEVYSFYCALAGYDLVHDGQALVSYREHDSNVSGRAMAESFAGKEEHRTSKSRMRLATMRFLAEILNAPKTQAKLSSDAESWRQLTSAVEYRLNIEMEQAYWWNKTMFTRLRQTFFPARTCGKPARPREIYRILPYRLLAAASRIFNF
jgi:glycosyltransferase involved in cell wall biosynthesis